MSDQRINGSMDQVHGSTGPGPSPVDLDLDLDPRSMSQETRDRIFADDAAANRKLRSKSVQLAQRLENRRAARAESAADLRARLDREREVHEARARSRSERSKARRDRWTSRRDSASAAAPATLSMIVYGAAVASAVFGQVSVATGRYHWTTGRSLILAGFIELMALSMALTANRLRLRGERAIAPSILTWVFAGFAATVNVWGHLSNPLMATGLGAASLGGITLWEIRSSARHRDALRRLGMLGQPMTHFGWRGWIVYRARVWRAWKLDVIARMAPGAADLLALADAREALEQQQRVALRIAREARSAARSAARSGDAGPALVALRTYAQQLSESIGPADLSRSIGPGSEVQVHADRSPGSEVQVHADRSPGSEVQVHADRSPGSEVQVHADRSPGSEVQVHADRSTGTLTPGPEDCQPRNAKVHQISQSTSQYLDAVRQAYPDRNPCWSEVRDVVNAARASKGLSESKSTIARVARTIREERAAGQPDTAVAVNE